MVPPSRPNVTRLSDDSVMLRWYVPKNDGLPIQFFKVQYRMLGSGSHKIPRENWQTTNDDIPFGKRNRNIEFLKNFTSSVTGLKPDRYYKFRIIAVYSNNDNREGNTSAKFFLHQGDTLDLAKSNLPVPILERVETLSSSAVMLHWSLSSTSPITVDKVHGFYVYYRPTTSAEEYLKATIDGVNTRKFKLDTLEAGTLYEFKLQSFNELTASEFSAIAKGMTKKVINTTPMLNDILISTKSSKNDNSVYPVLAGAIGGGILLLIATVAACLCLNKRKHSSVEEEDKPQLDHIQADFVTTSQVLGISNNHHHSQLNQHPQHHNHNHHHQQHQIQQKQHYQQQQHQQQNGGHHHRLNGVLPRMNITPNPLAQDGDKGQFLQYQGSGYIQSNVGTIHHAQPYYQTKIATSPTLIQKRLIDYQQTPKVPPHQIINNNNNNNNNNNKNNNNNNNHLHNHHHQQHHQHLQQQPPHQQQHHNNPHHLPPHPPPPSSSSSSPSQTSLTPMLEQQRRTIDRNQRNLLSNNNYPINEENSTMLDGMPTRIPSLRRVRRASAGGNNNGPIITSAPNNFNGILGIPINGSPRVQRSPMPVRAALIKQRTRLGSHNNNNDNISSGSLNSIEV